ncbi:MAG: sensor histidine kinase [Alkalicoccus sp.]|nr:MAG: sensor histidine kinase [Alkalicoccus sp.]
MNSFDMIQDIKDRLSEAVHQARKELQEAVEEAPSVLPEEKAAAENLLHQCNTVKQYLEEVDFSEETGQEGKLLHMQEAEKKRLAREIHDGPAQLAAHALMRTEITERFFEKGDYKEAGEELKETKKSVKKALVEMRRLVYDLQPADLEKRGLTEAAAVFLREVEEQTGTAVTFRISEEVFRLREEIETAVYRFIQETVRNAVKHGDPHHIDITIRMEKQQITISVRDDGTGFDDAMFNDYSFGLEGLKERMQLFGGTTVIQSQPGSGTVITASIPVDRNDG